MPDRPTAEEREWLTARVADLAAEAGFERLVSGPLIDGADERAGVEVLLRRLLAHAGLGALEVDVVDLRSGAEAATFSEVDYAGQHGGSVRFEVRHVMESDLVGVLCHEVGKAFLDVRGVGRSVAGPHLGAVAAVYLGLGVPAANAAAGGLSAPTFAYLLALQRVVRGRDVAAHGALAADQRGDFASWTQAMSASRGEIVRALRLPPEREWPKPQTSAALPKVKAAAQRDDALPDVRRSRALPLKLGLVGLALALAAALAIALALTGCDDGPDVSGLSCEELLAKWQTSVFQAGVEPCGGDGDCVAVGEIASCDCTLSGYDAVPRGAYDDNDGPTYFVELAHRGCRDACQPSTPPLVAHCVANRCQVDFDGACAAP